MSDADDLHERLFGFRPEKQGAAYERLAALVLAVLGWEDVRHDERARPPGRRAVQQLDVTARRPDGQVKRLLVECKDWDKTVGKGTLDKLVGVRSQVGADAAAVVTTRGFMRGARAVAVDEDIALVVLRPYTSSDHGRFVRKIVLTLHPYVPSRSNFQFSVSDGRGLPSGTTVQIGMAGTDRLLYRDGEPAETLNELLDTHGAPMEEGTFSCSVDFPDGRFVPTTTNGQAVLVDGLAWTETMHRGEITSVIEGKGDPCLVVEQLDENGDAFSGRLVVDRDLHAWEVSAGGSVIERGELLQVNSSAKEDSRSQT